MGALRPTFLRYSITRRRFIVIRLRIRQCIRYCFAHLEPRRGRHFLSDWGSMSLTGHRPLSGRPLGALRVRGPSRISARPSCARRKNGEEESIRPEDAKGSFSSGQSEVWRQPCVYIMYIFKIVFNIISTSDFEFIPYFQRVIYWLKNVALLPETSKH